MDALDVNDDGKVDVADFLHIFRPSRKSPSNKSPNIKTDGRAGRDNNDTNGEGVVPEEQVRERLESSLRRIKSTRYDLRARGRIRTKIPARVQHDS